MKFLRFADLVDAGIVSNRVTLSRWQMQLGFPKGILIGPNSRVWLKEDIEAWIAKRAAQQQNS